MATLLYDVARYFTTLNATNPIRTNFGAAFTFGTNVFVGVVPATPTNCVTILPYGGRPPDTRTKKAQYPSLQIRVRMSSYQKGYKVTQAIINSMHLNDKVCASIRGIAYAIQSQPVFLEYDEEEQPIFLANMDFNLIQYTVS